VGLVRGLTRARRVGAARLLGGLPIEQVRCPAVTPGDALLLAAAGLGAGIVNGIAGGGSLISYPALLATGHSALVSNVTNTVGILPGYVGGAAGFRDELRSQHMRVRQLAPVGIAGGLVGAGLLLTTSEELFDWVAPILIVAACLLFAAQPWVARWVARRRAGAELSARLSFGTQALVFTASVYGGYFGAGLGVILLAVLGATLADPLPRINSLRGVLSLIVNTLAVAVFLVGADVAWVAAGVLGATSLVGGYLGARTSLRLPTPVLRVVVLIFGVIAVVSLLVE
jgi:uncharacterized membrane protein YfcA